MDTENILIKLSIFVLGLSGLLIARYIYTHKKPEKKPLVCMVKFDCQRVVHSDYSKIFGIPLEVLGMIYYALVALAYLAFIFVSDMPLMLTNFLVIMSSLAFIFSLYLIAIQIFVLKKGCSWCILSALISASIFILTMVS